MLGSWALNLTTIGYNRIELPNPMYVPQGSMIILAANSTGRVLMDNSGLSLHSDYLISGTSLLTMDSMNKKTFLINCLIDSQHYFSSFNITNKYTSASNYTVTAQLDSKNVLMRDVSIANSKDYFF